MTTTESPRDIVDRLQNDGSSWAQDLFSQAAEEIIHCHRDLALLQTAAEPLAALADQWDCPRSGTPSTPDNISVPVSLGELRSLARPLRSSRGGEAEPPRRPSPETETSSRSTEERTPYPIVEHLREVRSILSRQGLHQAAQSVGEGSAAILELVGETTRQAARITELEAEVARLAGTTSAPTETLGVPGQPALSAVLVRIAADLECRGSRSDSQCIGSALRLLREQTAEIERLRAQAPTVDVLKMRTSAGADYYVRIQCGGREATPYMFKDRYMAEYESAHLAWLLGLAPREPDAMLYNERTHPNDPATESRTEEFKRALRRGYEDEMANMQTLLARALTDRLRAEAERDAARAETAALRETRADG